MTARILVVDDEPALRRTLERALRNLKYEVVAVGDPHLVYSILERSDYDLVLLDLHLPQMSGGALFLALVHRWPRLLERVIFMTGDPWGQSDWPAQARRCPLLSKPFTLDTLAQTVAKTLAAARAGGGSDQVASNGGG